jgi:hypothetical protein
MKKVLGTTLLLLAVLAGCTPNVNNHTARPTKTSAGVEEALPSNIAGKPQTIQIPHQTIPPVLKAVAHGGQVRVDSGSRWHGRTVKLYYVPASNILDKGDHYELKSLHNAQYLTKADVQANGTWYAVWNSGAYGLPRHRPFFMMAQDESGEIGIVHLNTVN